MKVFRGGIIRLFEQGKSGYQIAKDMKLPYTTVRDIFPECIEIGISPKRNNGEWPPNSPDLCVEDFSLWSILENEACSKPHQSSEALKKSLVKAWNDIPQEVIDRAVDDFPRRLKKCIDAQGGHFENK
uniref:Transposase n=1 Tax=Acrobeloides nanus TaxID=290746 RepID=A0A914C0C8_9BILA